MNILILYRYCTEILGAIKNFTSEKSKIILLSTILIVVLNFSSWGQTPVDGLMMGPGKICNVVSFSQDRFSQYWEGTLKRENLNMGTITTRNVMYMGALGVAKNLNLMVGVPYVWTKASAGTFQGMSGIQDLSLDVKWRPLRIDAPMGRFSVLGVVGFSTPISNYAADYLPLSIGLQTTTGSLRGILHYQLNNGFFATAQAGYIRRSNIKIDRESYYTDRQHNTNEVVVPDVFSFSPRIGFTNSNIIAEIFYDRFYSLSGSDIRRNDMPFPANAMRAEKIGAFGLYRLKAIPGFGFVGGATYTLNGRNVGKSTGFTAGITYIFNVWKPKKNTDGGSVDTLN